MCMVNDPDIHKKCSDILWLVGAVVVSFLLVHTTTHNGKQMTEAVN